jgi:hypothetical protein
MVARLELHEEDLMAYLLVEKMELLKDSIKVEMRVSL